MTSETAKKQLQYAYCQISQVAKAIRQWNLISWENITRETFFLKNHAQKVIEKLFTDSFLKNQNWAYLWTKVLYSLF